MRVPDVDRHVLVGVERGDNPFDQVIHIAEGAGLVSFSIDGKRLAEQRLFQQIGQGAAVLQVHARTISIEDAYNAGIDVMKAMIGHGQ